RRRLDAALTGPSWAARIVGGPSGRPRPMPLHPAATPCLLLTALALALSACGEREQGFEPVVVEQEADPLPAPLPATGPVTGPGPGAPPPAGGLVGDVPEPGATAPIGLSVVAPVDGTGTLHIVDADADP